MNNLNTLPVVLVFYQNHRALDRLLAKVDQARVTKTAGLPTAYHPNNKSYGFYFHAVPVDRKDVDLIYPFISRSINVVKICMVDEDIPALQFQLVFDIAKNLGVKEPTYLLELE